MQVEQHSTQQIDAVTITIEDGTEITIREGNLGLRLEGWRDGRRVELFSSTFADSDVMVVSSR